MTTSDQSATHTRRDGRRAAGGLTAELKVRRITSGCAAYFEALHRVCGLRPPRPNAPPARPVADLLAKSERGEVSLDLLFGAFVGDELMGECLAVESPGAAAMVLLPEAVRDDLHHRACVAALQSLQAASWRRSLRLLEVLLCPGSAAASRVLGDAGFRHLTRLRYLKREGVERLPSTPSIAALTWVRHASEHEDLFESALEATYAQSSDCPELSGLRSTADVLASHRATGVFCPDLWRVAMRDNEPVGIMLLNRILSEPALEIVYMGVAQPARGQGVANALLREATEAAGAIGVDILALAVDERNMPARRIYARWGFVEVGARDAWIASPPPA